MNHIEEKNHFFNFLTGVFFILLLFNVFTVTDFPIRDIAFTTMEWTRYLAFIIIFYVVIKQEWSKNLKPFYSGFTVFTGMYIIIHIVHQNTGDNSALILILLNILYVFALAHLRWKDKQFVIFAFISVLFISVLFIHWLYAGAPMLKFYSLIRNPNITGVFFSCLLFFPIVAFTYVRKWGRVILAIGIIMASILVYVTSARAAMLLIITVILSRLILLYSSKIFSWLFYGVIIYNGLFVLVYGLLARSSYFKELNKWSIENFGKNFFSGRQHVWGPAIDYGKDALLLGHKIGIVPKDFIEGTVYVHSHNQFLQIFLESGLVGLLSFLLLLFGIWRVYQKGIDSPTVQWSACFFLGIMIYQSVEISLFFNMSSIGLLHWFIISIGMSGVLSYKRKNGSFSNL
ncbi:O-antigen ligase family protein [Virgibacillus flavescens]|uniref:O-antigen ligase family protein n=1 Tax=Virgibacillus flavescens TaxID=1611422 RepID=UPI003D348197